MKDERGPRFTAKDEQPSQTAARLEDELRRLRDGAAGAAERLGIAYQAVGAIRTYYARVEAAGASQFLKPAQPALQNMLREAGELAEQAQPFFGAVDGLTYSIFSVSSASALRALAAAPAHQPPAAPYRIVFELPLIPDADCERRLTGIDPALGKIYAEARQTLHATTADPLRGGMFMLREALSILFGKLSPDVKVRQHFNLEKTDAVTREQRVIYAARHHVPDPARAATLESTAALVVDAYDDLSRAHARKPINEEAARAAIDTAIRLLEEWSQALAGARP